MGKVIEFLDTHGNLFCTLMLLIGTIVSFVYYKKHKKIESECRTAMKEWEYSRNEIKEGVEESFRARIEIEIRAIMDGVKYLCDRVDELTKEDNDDVEN